MMTKKIKTVCCECNDVICDGPLKDGHVSHGFCERCAAVIMDFIKGRPYDREYAQKLTTIRV